jgi:hypothetical protein
MRVQYAIGAATLLLAMNVLAAPKVVEETFDACDVYTAEDAAKALGTAANPEPINPKVKRPKIIPACTYTGNKDGKAVATSVQFRWGKTDEEAKKAFDEARLQFQTKPLLIPGTQEAFWSGKTGQLHVRKGRTWVTMSVGAEKASERFVDDAKKLADIIVKKL